MTNGDGYSISSMDQKQQDVKEHHQAKAGTNIARKTGKKNGEAQAQHRERAIDKHFLIQMQSL